MLAPGDFHSRDGWTWRRNADGSVTIVQHASAHYDGEAVARHDLDPSAWASVVAHVSLAGETGDTYREALTFHQGMDRQAAEALATCGEHIAQFFAYGHLPPHLQAISRPFAEQAARIVQLPRNPERTVALRKLLESKDAAVRAALAK